MDLYTNALALSDIAQFSFHMFSPHLSLDDRISLVSLFGERKEAHLLSDYCALGPGML